MPVDVDVWLRGQDFATTRTIEGVDREPSAWTDDEVRLVLEGMLRAMQDLKNPTGDRTPVVLRGLSWIVNPYEDGGVVIAIEITMGAAIAGPFNLEQSVLESMITRVIAAAAGSRSSAASASATSSASSPGQASAASPGPTIH